MFLRAIPGIRNECAVENGFWKVVESHRVFSACVKASSLLLMSRAECVRCRYTRKPANIPTYSLSYHTRKSSESIEDRYWAYTCAPMMDIRDHGE